MACRLLPPRVLSSAMTEMMAPMYLPPPLLEPPLLDEPDDDDEEPLDALEPPLAFFVLLPAFLLADFLLLLVDFLLADLRAVDVSAILTVRKWERENGRTRRAMRVCETCSEDESWYER